MDRRVPIGEYGLVGDTRTAALVAPDGAIDWCCLPRFDSPPVFGCLVGGQEAGSFLLGPAESVRSTVRRYRPGSATLETTWTLDGAELSLADAMVAEVEGRLLPASMLVRQLRSRGRPVRTVVRFDPRFGYDRRPPANSRRTGSAVVCEGEGVVLAAISDLGAPLEPGRDLHFELAPERPVTVVLTSAHQQPLVFVPPAVAASEAARDERGWQRWSEDLALGLPHRAAAVRSLITLRLLSYSPSGAPVAAPTTSLPERLGGGRNWDYRYAWPRDASIGVAAFLGAGKVQEARAFFAWLLHAGRLDRPRLPVLFTLDGRRGPGERELGDWPGYAGSRPVRVGNDAADQHQLDGYGWVLDAAWNLTAAGHRLYGESWRAMSAFADRVAETWRLPDAGIWERRSAPAHHVHSKLMGWLALDRALRIAGTRRAPQRRIRRWTLERDVLAAEIRARGFNPRLGAYMGAYGSTDLDAAALVLPVLEFERPSSPRVVGTVEAIARELSAGGPLLYRYPPESDGLPGAEGAFLPCSFWLAQALARIGRLDEAHHLFEQLSALGGPLGLYAEEMDPTTRRHLGNFPQALTHAALVQAALTLGGEQR